MDVMHGQAWYNQMVLVDPNDRHRNTVLIGGNLSSAGSTDGGATWTVLSNWLPGNAVPPEFPYVHADFHCAAMVPGLRRIFLGGDGGIFYSDDGAASFESGRNVGLSGDLVYAVISGGRRQGEALIGLQDLGTRYRRPNTPVWDQVLGGDGFGVAWSQANDALGVYETRDAGDHWTLVGAGLPQVHVHDLYLSPDGETLTAGTYGRGVWTVDLGH